MKMFCFVLTRMRLKLESTTRDFVATRRTFFLLPYSKHSIVRIAIDQSSQGLFVAYIENQLTVPGRYKRAGFGVLYFDFRVFGGLTTWSRKARYRYFSLAELFGITHRAAETPDE